MRKVKLKPKPTGSVKTVKFLLDHQADPGKPDAKGQTPMDIARRFKRDDVLALLGHDGGK